MARRVQVSKRVACVGYVRALRDWMEAVHHEISISLETEEIHHEILISLEMEEVLVVNRPLTLIPRDTVEVMGIHHVTVIVQVASQRRDHHHHYRPHRMNDPLCQACHRHRQAYLSHPVPVNVILNDVR